MNAGRSGSEGETAGERYAAKLLFQFRVVVDGGDGIMRTCEALRRAKRYGRRESSSFRNDDGHPMHIEFVGVLDLLHLGAECEEDEVWYDIVVRKTPMERAELLLPPEGRLSALRNERSTGGRRMGKATRPVRPMGKTNP